MSELLTGLDTLAWLRVQRRLSSEAYRNQARWPRSGRTQPTLATVRDFSNSFSEKNGTLIRYDIIDDLRKLYDVTGDESIRILALALIDSEEDEKYRKKYAGLWLGV